MELNEIVDLINDCLTKSNGKELFSIERYENRIRFKINPGDLDTPVTFSYINISCDDYIEKLLLLIKEKLIKDRAYYVMCSMEEDGYSGPGPALSFIIKGDLSNKKIFISSNKEKDRVLFEKIFNEFCNEEKENDDSPSKTR